MTRYVDRTRIVTYRRCPRRRYWEFEYQGRGIVPVAMSIPLVTGHYVHVGTEFIMRKAIGLEHRPDLVPVWEGPINEAVEIALSCYWEEVVKRGFDIEENEDSAAVAKEQAALTEALIRLFGMRVMSWLLADYDILDVEVECEWRMAEGLVMLGRPDAVLLHRDTGDIHLLSLKTKASWDSRTDKSNAHDDQGISETVCYESTFRTHKAEAVLMPHLLKGDRRKDKRTGQYVTYCPLIRGYRKEGLTGPEFAHSWTWTDENGSERRLGRGWERFNAWETDGGVNAWMQLLATGTIQPEAGDPLASSIVMPTPYYRQQRDIEAWKRQVIAQEVEIEKPGMRDIDWDFPQYRHSCHYPSNCPDVPLCFGPPQMAEDPLATGKYQWREPHHEAERQQLIPTQAVLPNGDRRLDRHRAASR